MDTVENNASKRRFGLILAGYIILKPIYLRSSGSLQIADVYLLLSLVYLVVHFRGKIRLTRPNIEILKIFAVMCIYQLLVNSIWSIVLGQVILKANLYYIFNLLVVFVTLIVAQEYDNSEIAKYITSGCLISLIITSIGLVMKLGGARRLGFFNNPNQLGYYALLILSIYLYYNESANRFLKISIVAMSVWAIIASGSKAAFVGAVILILLHLLFGKGREGKTLNRLIVQIILLALMAIMLYILFFSNSNLVLSNRTLLFVRRRMLAMTTESDSALGASRGYDRIWELGSNFLWGMGEGYYQRFTTLSGLEAHSSYVTLIVSYGVFGILGYALLLWKFISYRPCLKNNLIIISGVMIYGITHNGLRNTLLWILLTIMFSQRWLEKEQNDTRVINTPDL